MSRHPIYKIQGIRQARFGGVTQPSRCQVPGIIKFDSEESHHCVYNEAVCGRLAQTLHAPVADGVLTLAGSGPAFVSLHLESPGKRLGDMRWSQRQRAAQAYPGEVGALVLFDLLVGNWDRARNIKVSLVNPHLRLFRAFDHSHALLSVHHDDPQRSIDDLCAGTLIVRSHPFYGLVTSQSLAHWLDRFLAVPDGAIRDCCEFGVGFGGVSQTLQEAVTKALIARRLHLPQILKSHSRVIETLCGEA